MKKFLKIILYLFLSLAALVIILLGVLWFSIGDAPVACDEGAESVLYAKALPSSRLEKLYRDMEKYSADESYDEHDYFRQPFPKEFEDLKISGIRPKRGYIEVKGCMDTHVMMYFHGLSINEKRYPKKEIVLTWGEHEGAGEKIIWQNDK